MTPWDIIKELESDNSRLYKEGVVKREAESSNTEFFKGVQYALDKLVTYGVKQVPEAHTDGEGLAWEDFEFLATELASRNLTGHAARDAVYDTMMAATIEQWNTWYRRILLKDLRCGVSEKTINNVTKKVNKDYMVPVFSCQLAHDGAKEKSITGPKLVEVKLDGVRVITIVYPDGNVQMYSRNGKELNNFSTIVGQFTSLKPSQPLVFDGEVMSSSFQDLMKQVYRKSDVQTDDAVLYLFDMITLDEFKAGISNNTQYNRSTTMKLYLQGHEAQMPNVKLVEQEWVDLSTTDGNERFKQINQDAIAGGYEGIMLKDPGAPYEIKRTKSWLKVKPVIEVTLEVVDVEEGTGKFEGTTGALVCRGTDTGREITVNVGSGLSDANRDDIWSSLNSVKGQLVEIKADAITQNQDGTYSLRFPRFKCFRGFDPGEKL